MYCIKYQYKEWFQCDYFEYERSCHLKMFKYFGPSPMTAFDPIFFMWYPFLILKWRCLETAKFKN